MFVFSLSLSFGMYYINLQYNSTFVPAYFGLAQVQGLVANFTGVNQQTGGSSPNAALLFGDFLIAATVVFNSLLGGGIVAVLSAVPNVDISVIYLIQIIYGTSSIMLWVYIISNRSI